MQQNFLSPSGFSLSIKRLPNVAFFIQGATIPNIALPPIAYANPLTTLQFASTKLNYGQFNVTIRVDENMDSYNEIYNWMTGLAPTKSFNQYKTLNDSDVGLYSDASLVILNSNQIPAIELTFNDIFPVSLGSITLDTTSSDVTYVTCEVTFEHNGFQVTRINN
jgi:hypothetical protein